jgi:hypothetical protein
MPPRSGFDAMARLGYVARGIVYAVVGGFALVAALAGERAQGTKGALQKLLTHPAGLVLLCVLALGLVCFAAWRLAQCFLDVDHEGRSASAIARRAFYGANALFYVGLAIWAVSLMFQSWHRPDNDQEVRDWTAWLLSQPLGPWLLIALGIAIAAAGVAVALKGLTGSFERRLEIPARTRRWLLPVGRFGHLARAVVFVIIGGFLIAAAVNYDPREALGLGGSLRLLQQQPYGWALLAVTAAGILAFAAYQVVEAAYRRVSAPAVRQFGMRTGLAPLGAGD